ncbi:NAD-dependent epimerase/dehydratase family protein [Goodfellowiella coeruleoviolacea]|uniref:Nucleoside-diphosphate-sugar epimerase n=1 Tax=Goodfellowiella coeruleoviolacea TaxID=334858 RepID=A0AAE3GJ21_9PSEU|nr:NAD(P)-dependent oxidoreductase [Goodfellowiella coeruleoviolacea]MCP2168405.1 Nucleoside-diphosphate-sugar epimerase [Goodfellowiella coeruleoviolacea]
MRVFVAGATGAIGRFLVPLLVAAGHQVTGTSRGQAGLAWLRDQGAHGALVDVFDPDGVRRAVTAAGPDVVVHQLTALSGGNLADNARIRREGTRNLVDAAHEAGVRRIVAQSIAWAYQPGTTPADERTPLDVTAPPPRAQTVAGVQALEDIVTEIDTHVILRYGMFYGPGTWYAPGGRTAGQLAAGELAADAGVTSFVHVADAAEATLLALDWPSGPVNVVDDEPAPAREWVPVLADALDAPAPEPTSDRAPWQRGADNALARSRGWQPRFPSWRTGFPALRR